METFSALLAVCEGNPPVTGGFPPQRPVMPSFDDSFDLRLNKQLSKQSRHWWFETLSNSLWCHCNGTWNVNSIRMKLGEKLPVWVIFTENIWYCKAVLTHWGKVTHICVSKLTIISSDDGLSPGRRQAIIWTNAGVLLVGRFGTNFSEILV